MNFIKRFALISLFSILSIPLFDTSFASNNLNALAFNNQFSFKYANEKRIDLIHSYSDKNTSKSMPTDNNSMIINNKLENYFSTQHLTNNINKPSTSKFFDYEALKIKNISITQEPKKSTIISTPRFFHSENLTNIISIYVPLISMVLTVLYIFNKVTLAKIRENTMNQRKENLTSLQVDLIHFWGKITESRSGETAQHTKRVANLSARLAELRGLPDEQVNLIRIVSPLHDVGKIAIPETILNKPGKLTQDEFNTIKTHTTIGFNMLNTKSPYLQAASIIAHEHHEHWNGNGYPIGKKGEEIHIFSRITSVADVFDALLSKRCYKDAWPLLRVVELFEQQSGKQFEPKLVEILLENIDEFVQITNEHSDEAIAIIHDKTRQDHPVSEFN